MPHAAPYNGTPNISTKTITKGATASKVVDAFTDRICLMLANTGTVDVYIGTDNTVTDSSGTGWLIKGGQTPPDILPDTQVGCALYAYVAAGASTNGTLLVWDNHR